MFFTLAHLMYKTSCLKNNSLKGPLENENVLLVTSLPSLFCYLNFQEHSYNTACPFLPVWERPEGRSSI